MASHHERLQLTLALRACPPKPAAKEGEGGRRPGEGSATGNWSGLTDRTKFENCETRWGKADGSTLTPALSRRARES
jgi:hypothetical protein